MLWVLIRRVMGKILMCTHNMYYHGEIRKILLLHKNVYCGYPLEAPEALLMSTHNICFCGEIRKIPTLSD